MKSRIVIACIVTVLAVGSCVVALARPEAPGRVITASWYSVKECTSRRNPRCLTASGEPLNDGAYTCASWFYKLGTRLRVSHGGRSVIVRVNDRGPARRLVAQGREIDLSKRAFADLAPLARGIVEVTIEEVR